MGSAFSTTIDSDAEWHGPSVEDVLSVKSMLGTGADAIRPPLPIELIDIIMDLAEYWPHSSIIRDDTVEVRGFQGGGQDLMYLRTMPLAFPGAQRDFYIEDAAQSWDIGGDMTAKIANGQWSPPRGKYPCRKIEFEIQSHDQGWGGDPGASPYDGSYTWFDADAAHLSHLEEHTSPPPIRWSGAYSTASSPPILVDHHPQSPLIPTSRCLQKNVRASREAHRHLITWHYLDVLDESVDGNAGDDDGRGALSKDGTFVRSLVEGDCVELYARARFPAWVNTIEGARITVYWAV
ncbi:hypothetical protein PLICRDRAFT_38012 [Plicaturopsis crispa FD-325 SS-3]|nr:hypothetical protein PLICRDRAFT_38012 [Plicaturopsis crispa FD-325 SS-3]